MHEERAGVREASVDRQRRNFLKRTAAVGGLAATGGVAGCVQQLAGGSGSGATQDDPLTLAVWGGFFEDALRKHIATDFEKETGIPIEVVPQDSSPVAVSKYVSAVQADKAPVDIAVLNVNAVLRGMDSDLWMKWDSEELEHLDKLVDSFVHRQGGQIATVGAFGWFINLIYNSDELDQEVDSWKVLWDSDFEDMTAVLALPESNFLLDIAAKMYFDGADSLQSREGIMEVIDKISEIKPQVELWFQNEASFQEKVKAGDIPIGQMYSDVGNVMQSQGIGITNAFLEEGSVLDHGEWCTLKTSNKREAALEFINYASQPKIQDRIAKNLGDLPAVKKEHLGVSEETFEKVAGPGVEAAIEPNYRMYVDRSEWLHEKWNQFITQT